MACPDIERRIAGRGKSLAVGLGGISQARCGCGVSLAVPGVAKDMPVEIVTNIIMDGSIRPGRRTIMALSNQLQAGRKKSSPISPERPDWTLE